jgi:hypothetical protein
MGTSSTHPQRVHHHNCDHDVLNSSSLSLLPVSLIDIIISYYHLSQRLLVFGHAPPPNSIQSPSERFCYQRWWSISVEDIIRWMAPTMTATTTAITKSGEPQHTGEVTTATSVKWWTTHCRWEVLEEKTLSSCCILAAATSINNSSSGDANDSKLIRFANVISMHNPRSSTHVDYLNLNAHVLSQQCADNSQPAVAVELSPMKARYMAQFIQLTISERRHEIICISGYDYVRSRNIATADCYNTITDRYTTESSKLPIPTQQFAAAIDPTTDLLYIIGGVPDNVSNPAISAIQCYNQHTKKWSIVKGCKLNEPRSNHAAIYVPRWYGFIILGGEFSNQLVSSVEFYSPTSNTCLLIPRERLTVPLNFQRSPSLLLFDIDTSSRNKSSNNNSNTDNNGSGNGALLVIIPMMSNTNVHSRHHNNGVTPNCFMPSHTIHVSPSDPSSTTTTPAPPSSLTTTPIRYTDDRYTDHNRRSGYALDISLAMVSVLYLYQCLRHYNGHYYLPSQ